MLIQESKYSLVLILLLLTSCLKKKEHVGTSKLTDSIYIEVYSTYSGGVFSGDSYSYYITDSINFRKFAMGTNHDDENVKREVVNGSINLYKVIQNTSTDTIETRNFNIKKLIDEGKWDK